MNTPKEKIPKIFQPFSQLKRRLDAANSQLVIYARDLKRLFSSERETAQKLAATNRQLLAFAKDLKIAVALEKQRSEELEKAYCDIILRLTSASKYKDEETGEHIQRLSHYSKLMALHLGWSEADAEMLFKAAPMHDLGKIAIPDAILLKQGPLTPEEWAIMKSHPGFGASLLEGSNSPLLQMARDVAFSHHERWDGTGYPLGLKGEQIPLVGRIVMIADVYDALRSQRPYKPAFDHQKTYNIILNGDGRTKPDHFDPQVLAKFRKVHQEFALIYDRFSNDRTTDEEQNGRSHFNQLV